MITNTPTYIIAEAGVNHDGSLQKAFKLIDAAVGCGADAIKFQTFNATKLAVNTVKKAHYQMANTSTNESQYDMLKDLEISFEDHVKLKNYCDNKNIDFLSTPFDDVSLAFLANDLLLKKLKISSGDITNAPLLLAAAQTDCEIIISTGMCGLSEIEQALGVLAFGLTQRSNPLKTAFREAYFSDTGRNALADRVSILHCTSQYPAPFEEVNLRALSTIKSSFLLPVGYSDHTAGIAVSQAAAALGASIIEKHITLDRSSKGPDHQASIEPHQFSKMVTGIRQIEKSLGRALKIIEKSEVSTAKVSRRVLVANQNIKKGEHFTEDNISVLRAGSGLCPMEYWEILGQTATSNFSIGEPIKL